MTTLVLVTVLGIFLFTYFFKLQPLGS